MCKSESQSFRVESPVDTGMRKQAGGHFSSQFGIEKNRNILKDPRNTKQRKNGSWYTAN
jgi:hypothetical protein